MRILRLAPVIFLALYTPACAYTTESHDTCTLRPASKSSTSVDCEVETTMAQGAVIKTIRLPDGKRYEIGGNYDNPADWHINGKPAEMIATPGLSRSCYKSASFELCHAKRRDIRDDKFIIQEGAIVCELPWKLDEAFKALSKSDQRWLADAGCATVRTRTNITRIEPEFCEAHKTWKIRYNNQDVYAEPFQMEWPDNGETVMHSAGNGCL